MLQNTNKTRRSQAIDSASEGKKIQIHTKWSQILPKVPSWSIAHSYTKQPISSVHLTWCRGQKTDTGESITSSVPIIRLILYRNYSNRLGCTLSPAAANYPEIGLIWYSLSEHHTRDKYISLHGIVMAQTEVRVWKESVRRKREEREMRESTHGASEQRQHCGAY